MAYIIHAHDVGHHGDHDYDSITRCETREQAVEVLSHELSAEELRVYVETADEAAIVADAKALSAAREQAAAERQAQRVLDKAARDREYYDGLMLRC